MNIFELEQMIVQGIRSTPEYVEIIEGKLSSRKVFERPSLAVLRKDAKHWDSLFTRKSEYKRDLQIPLTVKVENSDIKVYSNIKTQNNSYSTSYDALQNALADTDRCLCQMISGDLQLIHIDCMHNREDIIAVIAFCVPSTHSFCMRYESSHEWIDAYGILENCKNLKYVAPIPEGVTDIAGAFENCTGLNCNIYLPSTVTWCLGMLKGCSSFSSKIYYKGELPTDIGVPAECIKL